MASRLLASLVAAVVISPALGDLAAAQTQVPNTKQYRQRRMGRGIDDGMVKRAPRIGDEHMARKAPENIDDGIFKPRSLFRSYKRTAKPNAR